VWQGHIVGKRDEQRASRFADTGARSRDFTFGVLVAGIAKPRFGANCTRNVVDGYLAVV
jgi:hypothetical protein